MYKWIIGIGIIYIILASVCCKLLAAAFYYPLSLFGTVTLDVSPIEKPYLLSDGHYAHVYLRVNGKIFEPRFFGLLTKSSVDYSTILETYNNPTEFKNACHSGSLLPPIIPMIKDILGMLD